MSFEPETELEQFVCRFLDFGGAIMEKSGNGFEVIMPGDLSARLGAPEHIFVTRKEVSQNDRGPAVRYSINYGSALLDRMVAAACSQTPLLCCRLKFDYIKTQGFDRLISLRLNFSGSVGTVQSWGQTMTEYLFLTCRYLAQSDEQKEGLVSMIFNLETGATVPEMAAMLNAAARDYSNGNERSTLDEKKVDKIMHWVQKRIAETIEHEITPFQQSMTRRFRRDVTNLRQYYASLEKEMQKSLLRPRLSRQMQEDRKAKIALLPEELQRKENDLFKKYSIRVKTQPCAALLVRTPVVKIMYRATIGRKERRLSLMYNPCTKSLDPLVCEGCGQSMTSAFFNDQLHLLCHGCRRTLKKPASSGI